MKTFGVIMAGGGGTRFWPLSRQSMPKQLLNLSGKDIMVNEAIDRLRTVVERDHIFIITNEIQAEAMRNATKALIPENHILSEPAARNTAACIGYAAVELITNYGDGVMVITPSDAHISDVESFSNTLNTAVKAAEESEQLVTIGIEPTFPATGYGYIRYDQSSLEPVKKVETFKEKPNTETALQYIQSGGYLWNSGIFVWKASVILKYMKQLLPQAYEKLMEIQKALNTETEKQVMERVYPQIERISIDYGIMEKADSVVVVPGTFDWSDVGSWDMLDALHKPNEEGNIMICPSVNRDTADTIAYAPGKLVATIGVENLIIVETKDALLVCDRNRAQEVKEIVEQLKIAEKTQYL